MHLHVVVAMPSGVKDGIDFDEVYADLVEPALAAEGFQLFRADPLSGAAEVLQQLLMADLVVFDLSLDIPQSWYQLGVRHALRSRGVILITCRASTPFSSFPQPAISYHVKDGVPDPATLAADRQALARCAETTCRSWSEGSASPLYRLLPQLREPDWKALCVQNAGAYTEMQEQWVQRIALARSQRRPGDILVLVREAPNHALLREAHCAAGNALFEMGQLHLALEQFEKVLKIDPRDVGALQAKSMVLLRLQKHDEARGLLQALVLGMPGDDVSLALLGRVEKDAWVAAWRKAGSTSEQMKRDAAAAAGQLKKAVSAYYEAFVCNPCRYSSGISALVLLHLLKHLSGSDEDAPRCLELEGGVRWSIRSALARGQVDGSGYRARATLGELELLVGDSAVVERAYLGAVTLAGVNWFDLERTRQQLLLLKDLDFRPSEVKAALGSVSRALNTHKGPWQPRKVFLFSGHMIDAPGRPEPRFPPDKEPLAVKAIAETLERLQAGEEDLAMCGGACGADLIFAEECLKRGVRMHLRIPFPEPEFIEQSVAFAGEKWRERFRRVKAWSRLMVMPEVLGPCPAGVNPYERLNLWQLYSALTWGPQKVKFIALWDGQAGDGPGGTRHMLEAVRKRSGETYLLDITTLW